MNDMRKLMETIEQINEVSDFDGDALDNLIAQFEETVEILGIADNPVKKKELTQVVLARAENMISNIGHDNVLGNDHEANFGGWPDEQR